MRNSAYVPIGAYRVQRHQPVSEVAAIPRIPNPACEEKVIRDVEDTAAVTGGRPAAEWTIWAGWDDSRPASELGLLVWAIRTWMPQADREVGAQDELRTEER